MESKLGPGIKLDEGKPPLYRGVVRSFPKALKAIANLASDGADKHTWDGWRSVPDGIVRYKDAAVRHLVDQEEGLYTEEGFLHATAFAWNALVVLELILDELEEQALSYEESLRRYVGGPIVRDEGY